MHVRVEHGRHEDAAAGVDDPRSLGHGEVTTDRLNFPIGQNDVHHFEKGRVFRCDPGVLNEEHKLERRWVRRLPECSTSPDRRQPCKPRFSPVAKGSPWMRRRLEVILTLKSGMPMGSWPVGYPLQPPNDSETRSLHNYHSLKPSISFKALAAGLAMIQYASATDYQFDAITAPSSTGFTPPLTSGGTTVADRLIFGGTMPPTRPPTTSRASL